MCLDCAVKSRTGPNMHRIDATMTSLGFRTKSLAKVHSSAFAPFHRGRKYHLPCMLCTYEVTSRKNYGCVQRAEHRICCDYAGILVLVICENCVFVDIQIDGSVLPRTTSDSMNTEAPGECVHMRHTLETKASTHRQLSVCVTSRANTVPDSGKHQRQW